MTLVRRAPAPFGDLVSLRTTMDRLFDDSFVRARGWGVNEALASLPLDITSTADAVVVEAALPGYRPEDVEITVEDRKLSIRAETREERETGEGEKLVREIRRGAVRRVVTLPAGLEADKATATFEHGVLRLTLPRSEAVKPRQIRISPTIDGQPAQDTQSEA